MMKKLKIILASIFSILIFSSCLSDLDINDNPDIPNFSEPQLTLPVAQQSLLSLNARQMNYLGNFMTYAWSTPSNWSANANLIRYNITNGFYESIFNTSYSSIFKNLTYIENYDDELNDYSAYKVMSIVLKGYQYQYLVDLYGDVPYTEANLREKNLTPKYDEAEKVYKAIIDKLTEAAKLATNMPNNYKSPKGQDIIFKGDMQHWAELANTIKLRMLIRLSNTNQDSYIKDEIGKIDSNGAGYITDNVFGDPGYSDDSSKQNPFWGYLGKEANGGSITDRNDFTVASDYIVNILDSNNDPRLERLFSESKRGGYKGAEQTTSLPGTGFTSKDLSHVGPGLLDNPEQKQPLMLVSEAEFLQAEAIVRGYIPGGLAAAKPLYESAIKHSFEFLKVDDAATKSSTYYGQSKNNVSWNDSTDKIEAIITQKWYALLGTNGIEPWIELTRTGFPSGLPIPSESNGVRPVRLLYPSTEISRNSKNVPKLTKNDAFSKNPFWK